MFKKFREIRNKIFATPKKSKYNNWVEKIKLVANNIPAIADEQHIFLHISNNFFKEIISNLSIPDADGRYYITNSNKVIWCLPENYGFLVPYTHFVLEAEQGSQHLFGLFKDDGLIEINGGTLYGEYVEIFDNEFEIK
jgi:hypothetical protein